VVAKTRAFCGGSGFQELIFRKGFESVEDRARRISVTPASLGQESFGGTPTVELRSGQPTKPEGI